MRALIIASVSGAIVTVPASTSETKLRTRSLPRSLATASRPSRPSSTILSSSPSSTVGSYVGDCGVVCGSAIGASSRSDLTLQLLHRARVIERRLEQLLQLVVALQTAAKVGELGAQLQQLLERRHLGGDV